MPISARRRRLKYSSAQFVEAPSSEYANREAAIDGHTLTTAMQRLAESEKLTGPSSNSWKADPTTPHDLRRTFSTRLSALGVPKEDRDACMNHIPNDVGSKHYDLYDRLVEK